MIQRYEPPPDLDPELLQNLELSVRQNRSGHWAWDLTDSRDGSWFESMFEFDSSEHAKRSGLSRLSELQRNVSPSQAVVASPPRRVVVSADDPELFAKLKILLATGESIEITPARRKDLTVMRGQHANGRPRWLQGARRWFDPPDSAKTA